MGGIKQQKRATGENDKGIAPVIFNSPPSLPRAVMNDMMKRHMGKEIRR